MLWFAFASRDGKTCATVSNSINQLTSLQTRISRHADEIQCSGESQQGVVNVTGIGGFRCKRCPFRTRKSTWATSRTTHHVVQHLRTGFRGELYLIMNTLQSHGKANLQNHFELVQILAHADHQRNTLIQSNVLAREQSDSCPSHLSCFYRCKYVAVVRLLNAHHPCDCCCTKIIAHNWNSIMQSTFFCDVGSICKKFALLHSSTFSLVTSWQTIVNYLLFHVWI